MLQGDALSFRYEQGPWILQRTDVRILPGEVVGLPGPSGRGKTTLARLLCGYLQPVEGRVFIDGQPLQQRNYCPAQLLFQHPELAMNPRRKICRTITEAHDCSPAILQSLGIHPGWLQRYPHELSGGELQRIALARVMGEGTRYIVADEMTAMLDANTQALIWEVMLKWVREKEVGVLVISHDLHLLQRVADRIDLRFAENKEGHQDN